MLFYELSEIFQNSIFIEPLRVAASEILKPQAGQGKMKIYGSF